MKITTWKMSYGERTTELGLLTKQEGEYKGLVQKRVNIAGLRLPPQKGLFVRLAPGWHLGTWLGNGSLPDIKSSLTRSVAYCA